MLFSHYYFLAYIKSVFFRISVNEETWNYYITFSFRDYTSSISRKDFVAVALKESYLQVNPINER